MLIEPEELYDAHRNSVLAFTGEVLPFWSQLSWKERDSWQATADELNEARRA